MELFADYNSNKVKVKGTDSEILKYLGSEIWRVKTVASNTMVATYRTDQIDFGESDIDALKKRFV